MTTDTGQTPTAATTPPRVACKVWLSMTECTMLGDLQDRGHISRSAAVRACVLSTWERTFRRGPGLPRP